MNALFEHFIVEIVILDLFKENYEGFFELSASLLYIHQRLIDQYDLVLVYSFLSIVLYLIFTSHFFNLLRNKLTLGIIRVLYHGLPVENPALVCNVLRIFAIEAIKIVLADQ